MANGGDRLSIEERIEVLRTDPHQTTDLEKWKPTLVGQPTNEVTSDVEVVGSLIQREQISARRMTRGGRPAPGRRAIELVHVWPS